MTTPAERKVAAFGAFGPFHHLLKIYDQSNFLNLDRLTVFRNSFLAILLTLMTLCFIVFLLCDAWFCVAIGFKFPDVVIPFGMLITCNVYATFYIEFRLKIQAMDNTMNDLSGMVNERKCRII